jgi:hypothetical protein
MNEVNKVLKRGVSGAIVEQMFVSGKEIVRKTSLGEQSRRLINQYEWLVRYQGFEFIPKVISYKIENEIVSYDMTYYKGYKTLYEHAKEGRIDLVKGCIENLINSLSNTIHKDKIKSPLLRYQSYIKEKVENKVFECRRKSSLPSKLFSNNEIIINGKEYQNISKILTFLYSKDSLKECINKSESIVIHGDLTAENILANSETDFILLDPNPQNGISSKSCEYAKLFQSFNSNYEFMDKSSSWLDTDCNINLNFEYNENYKSICNHLKDFVKKTDAISIGEICFHEAVHFSRMLPYQLILNTENFIMYYARMIILFNEVMEEYE